MRNPQTKGSCKGFWSRQDDGKTLKTPKAAMKELIEMTGSPSRTIDGEDGPAYLTLTSCGFKEEGDRLEGVFLTASAAQRNFDLHLAEYLKGKTRIWWRRKPVLTESDKNYLQNTSFETMDNGYRFMRVMVYSVSCRVFAE